MNRIATTIVEGLKFKQDPCRIIKALEFLQYALWSRNQNLVQAFCDLKGEMLILDLLRPRSLESLSNDLTDVNIKMHLAADSGETTLLSTYPQVITGLAAIVLAKLIQLHSETMQTIRYHDKWVISRLSKLCSDLSVSSEIERLGALIALESICNYGIMRGSINSEEEWIDLFLVVEAVVSLLKDANKLEPGRHLSSQKPKQCSLLYNLSWKLAAWRACLEIINTLCIVPGLDVDEGVAGDQLPLRTDWKFLTGKRTLITAIFGILKFVRESMPKEGQQTAGTVFSGPGVYKGSGICYGDLSSIIRSAIFIIQRLGAFDPECRIFIMKQVGWVPIINELGRNIEEESLRRDLTSLFLFMGTDSSIKGYTAETIIENLKSDNPKNCFKAIRVLSCSNLIDIEQLNEFFCKYQGAKVLLNLFLSNQGDSYNEKVGSNFCIQRNPLRDATFIPKTLTWKTIIKAFAAHAIGQFIFHDVLDVIRETLDQNHDILFERLLIMLKSGTDLEKWGACCALANLCTLNKNNTLHQALHLKDTKTCTYLVLKLLNITSINQPSNKYSLFQNIDDYQWRFETWKWCVGILESFMFHAGPTQKEDDDANIVEQHFHQSGVIQTVMSVLKYLQSIHGAVKQVINENSKSVSQSRGLPQTDSDRISTTYDADYTLPSLVLKILYLLKQLVSVDKRTREILLWDEHLQVLAGYLYFVDINSRIAATSIIKSLIQEIHVSTNLMIRNNNALGTAFKSLSSTSRRLKQLLKNLTSDEEPVWPEHLESYSPSELAGFPSYVLDDCNYGQAKPELDSAYLSLVTVKTCGNPFCSTKEIRLNQFISCIKCYPFKWYCSKGCQAADHKAHLAVCEGIVKRTQLK